MSNIIKIKRSQVTATPASLAEGELAYSENSGTLFIGTSGSNVTAIGGTGALTNDFATISVSGQTDIVADQPADTLNFANGTGVTITTDASTDTVTISAVGQTDLSLGTKTSTTLDINSSTGTNVTIPAATTSDAGLMTTTQFDKLDNITITQPVDLDSIESGLSSVQTELDDTQTGAGLGTDGSYTANGSANYISTATSLKDADDKLDAQAKTNATAISTETTNRITAVSNVQDELDDTQTGAGLGTDGSYTANGSSNYITTATSLKDADDKLDSQIKANADAISVLDGGAGDIQTELDDTQTGAGLGTDGSYTANGSANYISTATSLKDADDKLDTALKTEETNRTTAVSTLQTEVDNIETGAGLNNDGTYTADSGSNYITTATDLADADSLLDTQIKSNADDIVTKLPLAGGTMSGNIVMGNNLITGLPTPQTDTEATPKSYVDALVAGLSWKNSVIAATTGNIDLTTGGTLTVDGISTSVGDRVLVMNQTNAAQNGIYDVASGAWSRSDDFDSLTPIDEINGAAVYVDQGVTYGDNGYTVSSKVDVLDTDDIIFTQFNGASAITAGIGLGKTGNTLYVNLGAGIVELPSDEVGVDVYPGGGLITTGDGTTSSTATGAQLAIDLDGSTLNLSANGLSISSTVMSDIDSKVEGPTSATDDHVVFFDGTTGKLVKDSGLTLSGSNTGDVTLANTNYLTISGQEITANTVGAAYGGTGITSYTVGDLLFASGTTTLGKLAGVATGNVLISGGVSTAPSWGKVSLTTAVSGTLPVANGGTGATTFTSNGIVYGNGTSALQVTPAGSYDNTNNVGQVLSVNSSNVPTWTNVLDGGSF